MNPRQEQILKFIVEEYVETAEPVSSKTIAENYGLDVSPATVRNDMAALEEAGLIRQPHTSAGRTPTELGYSFYIARFAKPHIRKDTQARLRRAAVNTHGEEEQMKSLAKELVNLSGDMAIAAFGPRASFYTGISNLFEKPEFQNLDIVKALSGLLDRFDDVVDEMFASLPDEPKVMIGEDNPFGKDTAAVVIKYTLPNGRTCLLGLLGPMRMDYQRNLGLIEEVKDLFDDDHI